MNPPKIPNTIDEIKKYKVKNIEIAKEEEAKKLDEAKKKRRRRNIIIGVVAVAVVVTAFIGYKKGWFGKGEANPN